MTLKIRQNLVTLQLLLLGASVAIACSGSDAPSAISAAAGSGNSAAGTGISGATQSVAGATNNGGAGATAGATQSSAGASNGGASGSAGNPASGAGGSTMSGGNGSGAGAGGSTTSGGAPASGGAAGSSGAAGLGSSDPTKKITVWLAGDSTMQLCTTACPCGWGSQFQPYLSANAKVVDSGAGGRSIQTWLYDPNVTTTLANGECVVDPKTYSDRWQAMLDPTTGMKPGDYLFIEFGINDGDPTCNRHVGTALFQSYLGVMAQAAITRGAEPVLLTSTSFMQCTGTKVTPNRGFGPETKAAATANNAPLIDLTTLSAALYTTLGLCPNAGDFTSTTSAVGKFFCDDHTHFETAGAVQVAGVVAQALRDQKIGLAAYLK